MNDLKEKAEQVKTQGALERGEFNPTGKPKEIYQYWYSHADKPPATENFCHFWRVVAIWAPLMFFRRSIAHFVGKLASKDATWITLIAVYITTAVVLGILVAVVIPIFMLGIPYIVANIALAGISLEDGFQFKSNSDRLVAVALFPGTIVYFTLVVLYNLIVKIVNYYDGRSDSTKEKLTTALFAVLGIAAIGVYASFYWTAGITTLWFTLAVLGIMIGILALFIIGSLAFDVIGQRINDRRIAREAAEDAFGCCLLIWEAS